MKDKFFIDTNIFVYSFDRTNRKKKRTAEQMIALALSERLGVVSNQVVQEFINLAQRKFNPTFSLSELHLYIDHVLKPLCDVYPDMKTYHSAIDLKERYRYSFYDSLIIAAALEANCERLYTEDLQHGQIILGMTIQNPFETL